MLLLVTAFEPFGGAAVNASGAVLELLPEFVGGLRLVKSVLPTAFGESRRALERAMADARPDALLCLGEAAGRTGLSVERVAVNLIDAGIPDNSGAQPRDVPVDPEGPAAYFSTLPVREMAEAAAAAGVPARLSCTAGTFVCNYIMYMALHRFGVTGTPCGFIHVPLLPAEAAKRAGTPGMDAETAARGIAASIAVLDNLPILP